MSESSFIKSCHPKRIYRPKIPYPSKDENIELYLHDICSEPKISGQIKEFYSYNGGDKSSTENVNSWDIEKPTYFLMCINEKGESYTIQIDDYYYPIKIKLPEGRWDEDQCRRLVTFIQDTYNIRIYRWKLELNLRYSQFEPDPNDPNKPRQYRVITLNVGTMQKAKVLKKKLKYPVYINTINPNRKQLYQVEEDYISETLNLLIDTKLPPSKWFRLKKWTIPDKFYSTAQVELKASWKDIEVLDQKITIPPLIIASFDIETDNPEGIAPLGSKPVICISTHICQQGIPSSGKTYTHYLRYPYKKNKYPYVEKLDKQNELDINDETIDEQEIKFINANKEKVNKNKCIPEEDIKPTGEIFYYDDERQLLMDWHEFIVHMVDPDIITGHNIFNYDLPYIFLRMAVLENICPISSTGVVKNKDRIILDSIRGYNMHSEFIPNSNFYYFSKLHDLKTPLISSVFDSKGQGDNDTTRMYCPGRCQIDLLQVMKKHPYLKMVDNRLKTISKELLGETKEDVDAAFLHNIWRANMAETIIAYCEKDAILPVLNLNSNRLNHIIKTIEQSRLIYSTLDETINRGTTHTLTNLLSAVCRHWGYIIDIGAKKEEVRKELRTIRINYENTGDREYFSDDEDVMGPRLDEKGKARKFKGAKVVEPLKGYYDIIVVLDFASLYPSIIMAYNLDSCSQINKKDKYKNLEHVEKIVIEGGGINGRDRVNMFVKKNILEGVLPKVLRNLYIKRKEIKSQIFNLELEAETTGKKLDEGLKQQLDAQQNAIKLVMNSSYGAKAAKDFVFGSRRVSECTTAMGRFLINKVIDYVKEKYKELFPEVIYGDTDSVMIKFKMENSIYENLYHSYEIGMHLSKNIKDVLPDLISLDFEKVYAPFFISDIKKSYVGKKHEVRASFKPPEEYPTTQEGWKELCEQAFKISTDSRGYCIRKKGEPLVIRNIVKNVINKFLEKEDPDNILTYLSIELSKIVNDEYSVDDFVQYKKIKRSYSGNSKPSCHAIVNQKMNDREKGSGYNPGDFIPHVHLTPESAHKLYPKFSLADCENYKNYCADDIYYVKKMKQESNNVKLNYTKYISLLKTDCYRLFSVLPQYIHKFENLFNRTLQELKMKESKLYNFIKRTGEKNNTLSSNNIEKNNIDPYSILNTKATNQKKTNKRRIKDINTSQLKSILSFVETIKKRKTE